MGKVSKFNMSRQMIHESNLIEGFDDPAIDESSFKTWVWLMGATSKFPLNHVIISKLNARLTEHQPELNDWRGTYRSRSKVRVSVGGREGAAPAHVDRLMDEWIEDWYRLSPKESHIEFEHIHPFIDGNGRTGRMLMWLRENMLSQPLTQITKEDVASYYEWFK